MNISKKLREITKNEAIESYNNLKNTEPTKLDLSRIGLKALDYFFLHHRLKAKTKAHISFYEAMNNKDLVNHLNIIVERYQKRSINDFDENRLLKAQYQAFQLYYGTINQFRPMIAKYVYTSLNPKKGILDYSAGWGGRLLAAMSLNIPYIGIDANTKLETSYRNMVKCYEPNANVKMIFKPSETVDFSKFNYDLVFTSPPYFMLEEYETMPAYKTKKDFLEIFFIPVTLSAWKYLAKDGYMALNIPKEMFEAIKGYLPKIKKVFLLPLSNRHPSGLENLEDMKKPHEVIYIWQKK